MAEPKDLEGRIAHLEQVIRLLVGIEPGAEIPRDYLTLLQRELRFRAGLSWLYNEEFAFGWQAYLRLQHEMMERLQGAVGTFTRGITDNLSRVAQSADRSNRIEGVVETLQQALANVENRRLPRTESELKALREQTQDASATAHEYIVAIGLGLNLDDVPLHRFIPVRVYLREPSRGSVKRVSEAVNEALRNLDFDYADDFPAESGSWFKKWFAKSRDALTRPEVIERLQKGERALELEYLQRKQAEADRNQAEGAAALIKALDNESVAVCQIGSILLVKKTDEQGRSGVVTRTLTQAELIALEKQPSVLRSPEDVFEFLDTLNSTRRALGDRNT